MRIKTLLAVFLLFTIGATAQQLPDSLITKDDNSAVRVSDDLDSLVNNWYVKLALKNNSFTTQVDSIGVEFPDSVYLERIKNIHSIVNLQYNSVIRSHIHVYTIRQRKKFDVVLGLGEYYLPMIEDIFDSYGLPTELKYMAIIESAFNPGIVNRRSGATGMWQFMYRTGKMYGLTINSLIDERKDPVKSTHAAAKYIRDLYKIYNDWILVVAAYNCGPGNVNKAIARSGNKKDYWDIYYRLPRETRGYIPQYVAAAYAVTYHAEHKLHPVPLNIPLSTDTIMVSKDVHLTQVSEVLGIPLEELKALNPQYKTGLVPGASKPMSLTLPMNYLADYIAMNDSIMRYKPEIYLNKVTQIADPKHFSATPTEIKGKTKLIYTVKDGDNLGFIAGWYGVSVSDLRYWNDIYRNTIRIGQKIAVYVDPSKVEALSKISTLSADEKQSLTAKPTIATVSDSKQNEIKSVSSALTTSAVNMAENDAFITHTVRYGDTIWDIVKMYDNVTTSQVLELNNISEPGKIKIGQVLKIKRKG